MKKALLISCFEEWYRDRLEPICGILKEHGYEIRCVHADYNHIGKKYSKRNEDICDYIHVPAYRSNISLQRIRSHLVFGKKVNELINGYKPDLIYLILPPNNTARYCVKYKSSNPNTKLIIDIIDLWPESMPLGIIKKTLPSIIWRKWRNDAIKVADHVFTECNLYQEKLNYVIDGAKASTLYLFKEQTEEERRLIQHIISKDKRDEVVRFAYLGSMNNIIDIEGICDVIKQFIKSGKKCELHAIGNGESKEKFEAAVQNTGCKTFFYGVVFDEEKKIRILAPCDYAFNMMKGNISVGLTIKSIDYLSYGLPLLNNIKGDTWKLVEKMNVGINIDQNDTSIYAINHCDVVECFQKLFTKESFLASLEGVFM